MSNIAKNPEGEKPFHAGHHLGDILAPPGRPEAQSAFTRFWQLGYRRLVPIIPPDAAISEKSLLFKRVGTRQDGRGKTPGLKGGNGWYSFDWSAYEADEVDLERWHRMGAGLGIKTGDLGNGLSLLGVDADTTDPQRAKLIHDAVERRFGVLPLRYGREPKALYPLLVRGTFQYSRIEFGDPKERVEILSDGRQFVADGIHPKTNRPYRWERALPPVDQLPVFDEVDVLALLAELRDVLPAASPTIREGAGAEVNQALLRGDPALIRKAVEATPNTTDDFPSREAFVGFGFAIKGALPDDPELAFDLYEAWAARWIDPPDGDGNDAEWVAGEWARMKPPYRVGASKVYETAERLSGGTFSRAEQWFEPISNVVPLFPADEGAPNRSVGTYDVLSIDELFRRPDPKFMLERHIPEASLGFLYGDPGTGKSFIALDWALHVAFGLPTWHGDEIRAPDGAGVIYIAAEGASGFKTRVRAWMKAHAVDSSERGRFGLIFQSVNFMQREDVARLAATLRASTTGRTCLLVIDTVSRAMPGADENLQKEMTLFVQACQSLQQEFGATVLGVHHANKSGDMRGSGVLKGAGDFVFKLERKSGAEIGTLRCEKQKDAPDGWSDVYRLEAVHVAEGQISLVPSRCEAVTAAGLTPDVSESILAAIEQAWADGKPWSGSYRSKPRYAVNHMCRDFGLDPESAKSLLSAWRGMGLVEDVEFSAKDHSRGLRVCRYVQTGGQSVDNLSETEGDDVFD